jgi:hypothetical protein
MGTNSKLKKSLLSIIRIRDVTISVIPLIPAIPNPGITQISAANHPTPMNNPIITQ